MRRGSLPIAVIDRIVNGTITTSELTRWLPVIEIVLSAAEDGTACQWSNSPRGEIKANV